MERLDANCLTQSARCTEMVFININIIIIIVPCIKIRIFLNSKRKGKICWTERKSIYPNPVALNTLIHAFLIGYCRSQKYEFCHIFKGFVSYP
jgi:hypothetical protein